MMIAAFDGSGNHDSLPCFFQGARSGSGGITWGQRDVWITLEAVAPHEASYTISHVIRVPDQVRPTTAQCLKLVRYLMETHESLRTLFILDQSGEVRQEVQLSGIIDVWASSGSTPGALRALLAEERFGNEWPIRIGLTVEDGAVSHVVLALSHLAADSHGLSILTEEILAYLSGGPDSIPPRDDRDLQPLDLAERQRGSERARKRLAAVEQLLRSASPTPLPTNCGALQEPRYWGGCLSSRAANLALAILSERLQVSSSAVALGGLAKVIQELVGGENALLAVISSQRSHRAVRRMVSTLAEESLLLLDLTPPDLETLIEGAWGASLKAFRNTGYDPVDFDEVLERVEAERAMKLGPRYYFNDRRLSMKATVGQESPVEEMASSCSSTIFSWKEKWENQWADFCLTLDDGSQNVEFVLLADTQIFSPQEIERILRRLEALLVNAALSKESR